MTDARSKHFTSGRNLETGRRPRAQTAAQNVYFRKVLVPDCQRQESVVYRNRMAIRRMPWPSP